MWNTQTNHWAGNNEQAIFLYDLNSIGNAKVHNLYMESCIQTTYDP